MMVLIYFYSNKIARLTCNIMSRPVSSVDFVAIATMTHSFIESMHRHVQQTINQVMITIVQMIRV
jgi:hypothetical protein